MREFLLYELPGVAGYQEVDCLVVALAACHECSEHQYLWLLLYLGDKDE